MLLRYQKHDQQLQLSNAPVSAQHLKAARGTKGKAVTSGVDWPAVGQRMNTVCFPVFVIVNILCFLGFCLALAVHME